MNRRVLFCVSFQYKIKMIKSQVYMSNSLLQHTTTCLGANIHIPQALSYNGQLVVTISVTYSSHK